MADIKVTEGNLTNSDNLGGSDVSVKVTGGGKSGLATITPQPGFLMDEKANAGILANMQKLADEIQNPWRRLNEGLKDVTAWTQYNKGPAFALREEAAANDRNTLYNIRQQQAAVIQAQQQAQAQNNWINQLIGKGGAGGGAGGAGGLPDYVINAINSTNPADIAAKTAILNNYFKQNVDKATAMQYDPNAYEMKLTPIPELGRELDLNAYERKQYYETGKIPARFGGGNVAVPTGTAAAAGNPNLPLSTRQNNPGNLVDPATGKIKTFATPEEGDAALTRDLQLKMSGQSPIVKERFGPQVGNFMSPALLAETWAPSTAPGNTPESTQNYGKAIADALGMSDPTAQMPNTPEALAKAKAAITRFEAGNNYPRNAAPTAPAAAPTAPAAAPSAAPAAAPTAAPSAAPTARAAAPTSGFVPPIANPISSKDFEENRKAAEDYRKTQLEIGKHRAVTAGTESGKSYSKMMELAETADSLSIPTAEAVLEIAKDPKRNQVLAYLHGGDKVATALHTIDKRLNKDKSPAELEEQYIVNKFGPQALEDYRIVKNASDKLGIAYAADVFKGARMGIGLEKMAQNAKGIGTDLPAAVNAKNAQLIIDAANFQKQKSKMFAEWAPSHGGNMADFHEFEASPEYVKFRDDAKEHFIQTYKGLIKPESSTTGSSKAQAEIERRKKGNQ